MKLFDYLESRYVTLNLELQKGYTVAKHAETQAAQNLITLARFLCRLVAYPKLIGLFLAIKMGIVKAPQSAQELVKGMNGVSPSAPAITKPVKAALSVVPGPSAASGAPVGAPNTNLQD